MATIYISYKLEERELAKGIASSLERRGHRAVYDAVALSPGEQWRDVLLRELSKADAAVILLTERALGSPFVLGEIGAARALYHAFGHMLILPVLPEGQPIPPVVSDLFAVRLSSLDDGISRAAAEIHQAVSDHLAHSRGQYPRVFISHRHHHVQVAEALVKVIEAAFEVDPSDLRCTSVAPYRLRAGDRTADRLRVELQRAEAVLGILTPDTKESSYVLFELGASWGRAGVTFPLLADGATLANVPAPIGDLHTLSLYNESDCEQLLDDLADVTTLTRKERRGPSTSGRIAQLVAAAAPR